MCGARGEGRGRAGAGAGAGAQRLPCRVAGVAARGVRTRGRSASRRPNFCLRPRGRRWRGRAVRPRVTSSHVNGFLLCCRRWGGGGDGDRRERVCARAARARFLPPAPSTSCRLHLKEKGRRKSWAATQVRVGDGRAGAGRLSGGGSGTAATPASRPRPPLPAPDRPRRARRERRPHRREQSASSWRGGAGRAGTATGRGGSAVGKVRGEPRGAGAGRREPATLGASRAQPVLAASCKPGAGGSRGSPAAPKCARRRKGAGPERARGGTVRRGPHLAELARPTAAAASA